MHSPPYLRAGARQEGGKCHHNCIPPNYPQQVLTDSQPPRCLRTTRPRHPGRVRRWGAVLGGCPCVPREPRGEGAPVPTLPHQLSHAHLCCRLRGFFCLWLAPVWAKTRPPPPLTWVLCSRPYWQLQAPPLSASLTPIPSCVPSLLPFSTLPPSIPSWTSIPESLPSPHLPSIILLHSHSPCPPLQSPLPAPPCHGAPVPSGSRPL